MVIPDKFGCSKIHQLPRPSSSVGRLATIAYIKKFPCLVSMKNATQTRQAAINASHIPIHDISSSHRQLFERKLKLNHKVFNIKNHSKVSKVPKFRKVRPLLDKKTWSRWCISSTSISKMPYRHASASSRNVKCQNPQNILYFVMQAEKGGEGNQLILLEKLKRMQIVNSGMFKATSKVNRNPFML
jgi:hypothetical protein